MNDSKETTKQASVHFQLLVAGTVVFLAVFFWVVMPETAKSGETINAAWHLAYGLSAIAVYVAFVVVVAGHALLESRPKPPESSPDLPLN